jgi:hypothetical protein
MFYWKVIIFMDGEINAPQRTRSEYVEFIGLCAGVLLAVAGVVTASAWAFALGLIVALLSVYCYRATDNKHLAPR